MNPALAKLMDGLVEAYGRDAVLAEADRADMRAAAKEGDPLAYARGPERARLASELHTKNAAAAVMRKLPANVIAFPKVRP